MSTIYGEVSLVLGIFGFPMILIVPLIFRELSLVIVWVIPSIAVIFGIIGIVRDESKKNATIGVILGAFELYTIILNLLFPIKMVLLK